MTLAVHINRSQFSFCNIQKWSVVIQSSVHAHFFNNDFSFDGGDDLKLYSKYRAKSFTHARLIDLTEWRLKNCFGGVFWLVNPNSLELCFYWNVLCIQHEELEFMHWIICFGKPKNFTVSLHSGNWTSKIVQKIVVGSVLNNLQIYFLFDSSVVSLY